MSNVKVNGRALKGSKERAMMGRQSLEFVCDDGVCGPTQQLGSKKQRDNPGPLPTHSAESGLSLCANEVVTMAW